MGSITIGSVINEFERKILDETNDDTDEAENIGIFNNCIRTMINLASKIHTETEATRLAAGILQFLPAKGFQLVDIPMNMGSAGQTPGTLIRETTLKIMSDLYPQWTTDTPADAIEHFMKDDNDERRFYAWPPVTDQVQVWVLIQMSTLPTPVVYDVGGDWRLLTIPIEDQYIDAIYNGMLYMYYDDDSDNPGNTPRSQSFYQRFMQGLQIETTKPRLRQS